MATNKKRKSIKRKYNLRNLFRNSYTNELKRVINNCKIENYDLSLSKIKTAYIQVVTDLFTKRADGITNLNNLIETYKNQCDITVEEIANGDIISSIIQDYVIPNTMKHINESFKLMNVRLFDVASRNKVDRLLNKMKKQLTKSLVIYCKDYYTENYDICMDVLFNTIVNKERKITDRIINPIICSEDCYYALLSYCKEKKYKLNYILDKNYLYDDVCYCMVEEGKQPYSYIADYRSLSILAKNKGFDLIRCNGDHGIFRNNKGHVVVIPQGRKIGKGLSIKIQKNLNGIGLGKYWKNTRMA